MSSQTSIQAQAPEERDDDRNIAASPWLKRLALRLRELASAVSRFGVRRTLTIVSSSLRENRRIVRLRLHLFRLASWATFHRAIDVTELWNHAHRHLVPQPQKPGVLDAELLHCPVCGEKQAVRLLAHLRLGARGWAPMRCVLSCFACHRYSLPVHQLLVPWIRQVLTFQSLRPTRIHAKLWTDASRVLNLEPTTYCNFSCWYCVGRHMKQEHLTYENFVKIIDASPSLKHLALTGEGEPMMNKRFFDMVRYAKQKGLLVGITTNGSMFSQSNVRKLCDVQVDYLQISIDSSDPKQFAESRVGGDLRKVWEGIERLTKHRNQRGLTRPLVIVRGTLFSYSENEIPAIVEEARKRGVDAIGEFQTLNPKESYVAIYPKDKLHHLQGAERIGQTIRKDRIRSKLPFLAEIRLQDFGEVGLEIWPNPLRQSCDIAHMYSLLSGDMTPCCQIKSTMSPAWNLARHGANAVLADEQYENVRFNLWNGLYLDACGSCRGYTLAQMASGRPALPVS